ncbi:DUF262 domain-containing protein, partial [Nonomuraea turkmeniaca]
MAITTRQTDRPLEHRSLNATNREAVGLARLVQEGDLLLDTPYQRGDVWTLDQRIALVKSWLLGLPIPAMIINDRMTSAWERDGERTPAYAMIDGKQRTLTAIAWYNGDFAVPASWFPSDQIETVEDTNNDGPYVRFNGLTIVGQRRFMRMAQIPVCEARVSTLREEAEVFLLVNGSGTQQQEADLARA